MERKVWDAWMTAAIMRAVELTAVAVLLTVGLTAVLLAVVLVALVAAVGLTVVLLAPVAILLTAVQLVSKAAVVLLFTAVLLTVG